MPDEQFDIERDGRIYHADIHTVALLTAAQQYDAGQTQPQTIGERRMQDVAFDHAYETGRITQGPAYEERHEQEQTHSHGHRR